MVRLNELSARLNLKMVGQTNPELIGISEDSRLIKPGMLFAAIQGSYADGRAYIGDAIKNGAAAVLLEEGSDIPDGITALFSSSREIRALMSQAAAVIYGYPSEKLLMLGLTGTNGKTSSTYLLEAVLNHAGRQAGVIGTVNFRWPGYCVDAPNTTPEGSLLQSSLAAMLSAGAEAALVEISSHALSIGRVEGLNFDAALFSNLSRDHLDFHNSMESYYQAKKLLFSSHLKKGGASIINIDDEYGRRLAAELSGNIISFGFNEKALVRGKNLKTGRDGIQFMLESPWASWPQRSPLLARGNAYNILGVAALSMSIGIEPDIIKTGLEKAAGAPGRLERVGSNSEYLTLVDYSHSPDSLANALKACRELEAKKLICVMGCGGDRDRGKRPIMGRLSAEIADVTIITSDNPRTEDPRLIIQDIESGLNGLSMKRLDAGDKVNASGGAPYMVIEDRAAAITEAVRLMEAGDVLLIAGKGHEDYQIIGREKRHFDDCEEALKALKKRGLEK